MRSGRALRLGVWAFALAPSCASPSPSAAACREVISASLAWEIFTRLTAIRADDRCVMSDLTTQQSTMHVRWTRDGASVPGVVVVSPAACASRGAAAGRYVIESGAGFAAACPATSIALQRAFAQGAPAPEHVRARPLRGGSVKLCVALLAAVVALAALGWSWWRARRSSPGGSTPA